jgi:hypothetical protein
VAEDAAVFLIVTVGAVPPWQTLVPLVVIVAVGVGTTTIDTEADKVVGQVVPEEYAILVSA